MKIAVIYSADLPNTYANSINTMKHANAFLQLGHDVTVFYVSINKINSSNIHDFYDISEKIKFIAFPENLFFSRKGKFWKKIHSIADMITNDRVRYIFDSQKKIADYIIKGNFDFVYARNFRASYHIIKQKIPIIVETHAPNTQNPQLRKLLSLSKYQNFKISTISEILKHNFVEAGMPHRSIIVNEDAVDFEKFTNIKQNKTELRELLNLPVNKKIICYSGSLKPGKGIKSLIETANQLKQSSDIVFLIVGGNNIEVSKFKKISDNFRLKNIIFTGFVKQSKIPMYLKSADILIMLYSYFEKKTVMDLNTTSPIKLFEYMASKKPIIISRIPTIEKIVKHNKHVIMQEPDNINETKNNILKLINSKVTQEKIAQNAFELAKKYTYINRCKNILKYGKN